MDRLTQKLNSERGASITFALLLFLVCAVISSIVIVAASAASGRMAKAAEMDQRYYAVNSATELLKDTIDGQTVSVVSVMPKTSVATYDASGNLVGSPTVTSDKSAPDVYLVKKPADQIDLSADLTDANKLSAVTIDSILLDAVKQLNDNSIVNRKYSLSSSFYTAAGANYDALAATVDESLDAAGNMRLTVYNAKKPAAASGGADSGAGSQYSVVLDFNIDKRETTSTKTIDMNTGTMDSIAGSGGSYTITSKISDATITSYTWNLNEIKTSS